LLAVTVNVELPALVGVPLTMPVVESSARPAGIVPPLTANVGLGVPVAAIGNEYGCPTIAAVGEPEVIAGPLEDTGEFPGAQPGGTVTVLDCKVTAPLLARSLPVMVAPVVALIDALAITVPWNCAEVPIVAELPTSQNTLHALAPPVITIWVADPIVNVLAAWNTHTEFAEVPARVRMPLFARDNAPPE
jgi:hypothetical protein